MMLHSFIQWQDFLKKINKAFGLCQMKLCECLVSWVVLNLSIIYMHNIFKVLGFMVLFWRNGGIRI
jgi:hypothetical protein